MLLILIVEPMIDNITGVISDIGSIVKLVKAVISNDWGKAEGLEPLISSAFNIIKRWIHLIIFNTNVWL